LLKWTFITETDESVKQKAAGLLCRIREDFRPNGTLLLRSWILSLARLPRHHSLQPESLAPDRNVVLAFSFARTAPGKTSTGSACASDLPFLRTNRY
jgi:hypothetical protein